MSSDRGLCGGFNGGVVRFARNEIRRLEAEGKTFKLSVGRKALIFKSVIMRAVLFMLLQSLVKKTLEFYRCTKSIRCGDGYVCTR